MSEKIIWPWATIDVDKLKKPLSSLHISWCFLIHQSIEEIFYMTPWDLYSFLNSHISTFENKSENIQTVLELSLKCLEKQLFPKEQLRLFLSGYLNHLIQYSKISKNVMGTIMKIFDEWVLNYANRSLRVDYYNQQDVGAVDFEYLERAIELWIIKERKVDKLAAALSRKSPPRYRPNFVVECVVDVNNTEFSITSSREKLRWGICMEIKKWNIWQEPKLKMHIPNRIKDGASIELQFEFMEWVDFMKRRFLGARTMDIDFKLASVDDERIFDQIDHKLRATIPNYDKLNDITKESLELKLNERFTECTDKLQVDIKKTIQSFPIFKDSKQFRKYIFRLTLLFIEAKKQKQIFNKNINGYDDGDYILFIINGLIWYSWEYTHLFDSRYNKFLPIILNSWRWELKSLSNIIHKTNPRTSHSRDKQFDVSPSIDWDIELELPNGIQLLNVRSRNSSELHSSFAELTRLMSQIIWNWKELKLWDYIHNEIYYNEGIENPIIESKNLSPKNFRLTLDGYMGFLYSLGNELWSIFDAILSWIDNDQITYMDKFKFKGLIEKTWFVTVSRSHQTQIRYSSAQLTSKWLWSAWWALSQSMMSKVVEWDLDAFWDLMNYIKQHNVLNKIVLFWWKTLTEYLNEYEDFLRNIRLCVWNPKQDMLWDSDDHSKAEVGQFILDRLSLLWNTQLASSYRSTISQLRTDDGMVPISGMQRLDKMFMKLKLCRFYEAWAPDENIWWLSWEFWSHNTISSRYPIAAQLDSNSHSIFSSHTNFPEDGVEFATQFATSYGKWWYKLMKSADWRLVIVPMFSVEN